MIGNGYKRMNLLDVLFFLYKRVLVGDMEHKACRLSVNIVLNILLVYCVLKGVIISVQPDLPNGVRRSRRIE